MNKLETETVQMIVATRDYTAEQVSGALLAYAASGNAVTASEATGVPARTIRYFRQRFPEHFLQIAEKHKASIEKTMVANTREAVLRAHQITLKAMDATEAELDAGTAKDPAAIAQKMAVTLGIHMDKGLLLEGRPTSISHQLSGDEILRNLASYGQVHDIPQADIVEDDLA